MLNFSLVSWYLHCARPCTNGNCFLFAPTVESGVWLGMEGPHCKVFPAGGLHLWIPGVRYPRWLVGFIHLCLQNSEENAVTNAPLITLNCPFSGSAATQCSSYPCCSCWCLVWLWPSPSTCPCSAPCASLRASAWPGSSSHFMSSVSLSMFWHFCSQTTCSRSIGLKQLKVLPAPSTSSINSSLTAFGAYANIWGVWLKWCVRNQFIFIGKQMW